MKCPICKQTIDESRRDKPASPYPFCCERCKLIDLGRWLNEKYQIPVAGPDEDPAPGGLFPETAMARQREEKREKDS